MKGEPKTLQASNQPCAQQTPCIESPYIPGLSLAKELRDSFLALRKLKVQPSILQIRSSHEVN